MRPLCLGWCDGIVSEVTQLLKAVNAGECGALAALVDAVYHELHQMASRRLASESSDVSDFQTTELIHEAWMRLFPASKSDWQSRAHFFGAAAEAIRRVLVDMARQRGSLRRGANRKRFNLFDSDHAQREADLDLVLDINAALQDLQNAEPQVAEVVKLRYFAGLTNQETAEILGIGVATSQRYWAYARAWLLERISGERNSEKGSMP